MAAKLLIQQGGVTRELTAQDFHSVQYDTQADTRYELLDDNGNVIHDYTTRVDNGKLLIDVAGTSASPDFILNDYTTYFPAPQSGGMGSGYFGTAAAENVASSTAVKAATVGASGGSGALIGGVLGLAAIGGIAVAASSGGDKDKNNAANAGNQNNTNNNSGTQNKTDNNSGSQNKTDNSSGSQNKTDNGSGSQNKTDNGSGSQNKTDNGSGSQNKTDNGSGSQNKTDNGSGTQNKTDNGSDTQNKTDNSSDSQTNTDHSGSQTKDILHGNSIKLPTAYTYKVLSGSDLNAITEAATGGLEMNQYQSNEANKKIIISDLNNLPREVQTELSLFVAQLLNPIRKQWGVGLFKVTEGAMNFAQDIANAYTNDNKSIFLQQGHYVSGITQVAEKYGLNTGGNYYEDLGGFKTSAGLQNFTLDDLKKQVYDSIVRMLFRDGHSDHGHAKSLLNAMAYEDQNAATDYLGVDTSNAFGNELNMHFIKAPDHAAYVKDAAQFAATIQTPEITAMPMTNAVSATPSNTGNGEAALGLVAVGGTAAANTNKDTNSGSTDNTSAQPNTTPAATIDDSGNQSDTNDSTDNASAQPSTTLAATIDNSGSQNDTNGSTDNTSAQPNTTPAATIDDSGSQSDTSGSTDNTSAQPNTTPAATISDSGSQNDTNSGSTDNASAQPSTTPAATIDNSGSENDTSSQTKDILHGNSIKLPTAYTHKVLSGSDLNAITEAATGGMEMNKYQSSAENQKIIINDLNNLTREVQTELSLFVAQLLNPIRQQWGVATYKVTEGAMNFAQDVANEYTDNKQSIFALKGHYVSGIQRAAAKYGLDTGGQYYENAGAFSSSNPDAFKNITLDDLKSYVYTSVIGMLFDDAQSKHGHAKSLLNAKNIQNQDLDTDYLGVDTSSIHGGEFNIHFIASIDNDAYINDHDTFAATIQTPEITSMPAEPKTAARMVYVDDDNSHLSTAQFGDSDDSTPQITQTFTFSQLLEGNVRQLADEYDEHDVLALSQSAFTALNKDQSNLHEHISYDSTTGLLHYDADGVSGSIAPVAFAQLAQGLQQDQIQFEIL